VASPDTSVGEKVEAVAELGIQLAFPIAGTLGVLAYEGLKALFGSGDDDFKMSEFSGGMAQGMLGGIAGASPQGSLGTNGLPGFTPPTGGKSDGKPEGQDGSPLGFDMGGMGPLGALMALPFLGKMGRGLTKGIGGILGSPKAMGAGLLGFGLGASSSSGSESPSQAGPSKNTAGQSRFGLRQPSTANGGLGAVPMVVPGVRSSTPSRMPPGGSPRASRASGGFRFGPAGIRPSTSLSGGSMSPSSSSSRPLSAGNYRGGYSGGDAFRVAREVEHLVGDGVVGVSTYPPPLHPEKLMGRQMNAARHAESRGG
jgi:hypothetical protein